MFRPVIVSDVSFVCAHSSSSCCEVLAERCSAIRPGMVRYTINMKRKPTMDAPLPDLRKEIQRTRPNRLSCRFIYSWHAPWGSIQTAISSVRKYLLTAKNTSRISSGAVFSTCEFLVNTNDAGIMMSVGGRSRVLPVSSCLFW